MPRPATPTAIKIATGNPGGRPLNDKEPKAIAGAPVMPANFSQAEQVYWNELCKTLSQLGTLNTCNGEAMRLLCEAAVIRDEAKKLIKQHGVLMVSPQGYKKKPAITVFNEQAHTIRTLLGEFGLTEASRAKLRVDNPEFDSPLMKLLNSRPDSRFNESEQPN